MTKDQIPADDILTIQPAAGGAVVIAVRDRTSRCFDVHCSVHGRISVYTHDQAATVRAIEQMSQDVTNWAAKHAAACTSTTPRVATTGSPS